MLRHTVLAHGGSGSRGLVEVRGQQPLLQHLVLSASSAYGMRILGTASGFQVANVTFSGNSYGLYVDRSTTMCSKMPCGVTSATFTDNSNYGVYVAFIHAAECVRL